jgi:hypothetical protein
MMIAFIRCSTETVSRETHHDIELIATRFTSQWHIHLAIALATINERYPPTSHKPLLIVW